jgi:hypothetical protein
MWERLTKFIRYLFRSQNVDDAIVECSEAEAHEILRELDILFEAKEGEDTREFVDRHEKEHPDSRIYFGKHGGRVYGLVFPKAYRLHEWIEHRVKEVLPESELQDIENNESP